MNQRLLIRASGVKYAPELDLVVCFIEVLKLLINDARGSVQSQSNSIMSYEVDTNGKTDSLDGAKAGIGQL
ncbi:hypothetical protein N7533_010483 [Penicillium manginii]|uniref:uncharacterized protein n=1 Tax=Penicillium manginii TaxID=203109 RepID=UPI0025487063|nr:uncharacterized protein N7533_010483 [Penicillium manginii]KAJ5743381.1 hypothetical protein N7533_010483 [Penicillium manginii]